MDKFLQENVEKKAIILGFKKLKKIINKEIVKHSREFKEYNNKILILSESHARLMLEVLEKSLDNGLDLDVSDINSTKNHTPKLSIWNIPIYITRKSDVIMLVDSFGELVTQGDSLGADHWTQKCGEGCFNITEKEFKDLTDDLPDSSKFRRLLPEEMV